MRSELRPNQADAITALRRSLASGKRRPVLQAPCGYGKTVLAASIVEMARSKGNRVVFCAPAISLIDQTVQVFHAEGIEDVGVIQADHHLTDWSKPVQVASVQTLERREEKPDAQIVIVDEAHRQFKFLNEWMASPDWQHVPFIGLSATPWARGMGKRWDDLIVAATTGELIEKGYLSPFKVYAPAHPDLTGVKTVAGDYHEGQLSDAMNQEALVADIVSTWRRLGEGRPTLCYGVDRAHAKSIQDDFNAAGITCEYVDAFTDMADRESIRRRFEDGHVQVVSSVGCLTTGIDWDVRCIILGRPTKSEILHTQIIGRGLRTAPGKDHLIVLDHADNHSRLGFVTDIHHGELDAGRPKKRGERREKSVPLPKECPQCTFLMPAKVHLCPNCGAERCKPSMVETIDGELAEMKRAGKRGKAKETYSEEFKTAWYWCLTIIAAERGYKSNWANVQWKHKFGKWPPCDGPRHCVSESNEAVMPAVRSWVRSRMIAYAKSKQKAAQHATA